MAIAVIQKLQASPTALKLPRRVYLDQILSSTLKKETCRVEYSLAAEHDVCFPGGAKTARRELTVAQTATPVDHRLDLEASPQGSQPAFVYLIQGIEDQLGQVTRSRVRLDIVRK